MNTESTVTIKHISDVLEESELLINQICHKHNIVK